MESQGTKLQTPPTSTSSTSSMSSMSGIAPAYNGKDRNAFLFGWNPQAELWNGRFAMIGFTAYLLWDLGGYSVLRDLLHLVPYAR